MENSGKDNYGFNAEEKCGVVTNTPEQLKVEETKKKVKTKWTCCQITLLTMSLLTVALSAALFGSSQVIFDTILKAQLEVVPGSYSYKMWHYTPVPIYLRFYLFNITNPEEFAAGGMAVLEEVGPYVYRELHEKMNMTFNDNDTVTYYQQRKWLWDKDESGSLSQDDQVIVLNTVPVAAAWAVRRLPFVLKLLNTAFHKVGEKLFVTTSVRNVIFEGFTDPVLDLIHGNGNGSLPPFLDDGLAAYDKFAWFYKRNLSLTYDGLFNMHTGHDTLDNLGLIDTWNEGNTTTYFDYPCNVVNGSAGELWPPGQQRDQVSLFSPDLCMTMTLYYKEDIKDSNGLPGYRYWGTNETLPGDGCYCIKNVCAPSGTINAQSCRMGAPAYVSFPHYLHADPSLLDTIEGLSPDPDKHGFYLDIIPEVGIPMHVLARMQINMLVRPYRQIDILKKVPKVYLPLLWFEEEAVMPHNLAWQLQALLLIMNTPIIYIILGVMLGLGVLGASLVIIYHWRKAKRNQRKAYL